MTNNINRNNELDYDEDTSNFALPNKQGIAANTLLLGFLAAFQFFLLWSAMSKMLGGGGSLVQFTSLIISLIAVVCAYTINHLAVTRGAVLSALNFKGIRLLSIIGIVAIGFAISSATITGNVQDTVGTIQLQEHQTRTADVVGAKNDVAIQATQAAPVLTAIINDLVSKVECERLSACLSESGLPGTGPITRLLVEKSARAQSISDILADGEIARQESLARMSAHLSEYQETLDSEKLSFREKRSALQKIHTQIVAEGATLDSAIPTNLLFAYATELQGKVELEGRSTASRNVDAVLNGHGKALQRALDNIDEKAAVQFSSFPKRASLADTVSYITYYWPFAAVVYGAEIGLPLMLFFVTYARLYWVAFTEQGINPTIKRRDDVDEFREQIRQKRLAHDQKPRLVAVNQAEQPVRRKVGRTSKLNKSIGKSRDGVNGQ